VRETWTLYAPPAPDGYVLTHGWVRDVDTREGLYQSPPKVGEDGDAGQAHGKLWAPKRFGPGGFVQQVWLMADLQRREIEAAYDELLRVASWPYDLVRVVRGLEGGGERECLAELVAAVEPQPIGQLGMRFALEWGVPAGFWQDTEDTEATVVADDPSGTLYEFPAMAGGTAPMDTLQIGVRGPFTGPVRLTQPETGQWLQIAGNVAGGTEVVIDNATGTITGATSDRITYSGSTFLELPPLPSEVPLRLQVTHAGGVSAASRVRLTGRRRWLA
jgi:hypothetical protein